MGEPSTTRPARRADPELLREVEAGLTGATLRLPSKLFYDERGSRLFERITRLPEYYLTRTERRLLRSNAGRWAAELRPASLVELGAGSADKTRLLLGPITAARPDAAYLPVDVSAEFLRQTARALAREYPGLRVLPVVADISRPLALPEAPERPALFAFLGSTIGNFEDARAATILRGIRQAMDPRDRFLLGADLAKDRATLEAAYNDAQGVTAEFNRNALRVLNQRLGADFDPDAFEHRAFYDAEAGRIEMHLVARSDQEVSIPGLRPLWLRRGADILTEISCKYTRPRLEAILSEAGLRVADWTTDRAERYALLLARR